MKKIEFSNVPVTKKERQNQLPKHPKRTPASNALMTNLTAKTADENVPLDRQITKFYRMSDQ